jgi:hypothetical protein
MCEDVWVSGLNAYTHRCLLRSERWRVNTAVGGVGGLSATRNSETMAQVAEFLEASFGEAMNLKDPKTKSLYYWRLKVPF